MIYGNLLMDRPIHECEGGFSSRKQILGDQSQRKSSLMTVFFEQSEKREKSFDGNSSELMEMIHNRSDYLSDVNRSFLIESVIDLPKNEEEKEKENENDSDSNELNEIKEIEQDEKDNIKIKRRK